MSSAQPGIRAIQAASVVSLLVLSLPLALVPELLRGGGENRVIGLVILLALAAYLGVLVLVRPKASATWLGRGIAFARALAIVASLALLALAVAALIGAEASLLVLVVPPLLAQVALFLGARRLAAAVPEAAAAARGPGRVLLRAGAGLAFAGALLTGYGVTLHARRQMEEHRLAREVERLRTNARALEATANKLPQFRREAVTLEDRLAIVDALLPREPLTEVLEYRLKALDASAGIAVEALPSRRGSRKDEFVVTLPLRLTARGRLDDLVRLVGRASRLARLVRVEALDLEREHGDAFRARVELLAFSLAAPLGSGTPCERTDADRFFLAEAVVAGSVLESSVRDEPGLRHAVARYRISQVFKGAATAGRPESVEEICLTYSAPPTIGAHPAFYSRCPADGELLPGTGSGSAKSAAHVLFLRRVTPVANRPWWLVPRAGSPLLCGHDPTLFDGTPEAAGFEQLTRFQEANRKPHAMLPDPATKRAAAVRGESHPR